MIYDLYNSYFTILFLNINFLLLKAYLITIISLYNVLFYKYAVYAYQVNDRIAYMRTLINN